MTDETTGYQNPIFKIMQNQSQSQGGGGQPNNPMANNSQNLMNNNSMNQQGNMGMGMPNMGNQMDPNMMNNPMMYQILFYKYEMYFLKNKKNFMN